jgi:hypothetical protein
VQVREIEENVYEVVDITKNINATYESGSISGKGSRKYKTDILTEIEGYLEKKNVVDDIISDSMGEKKQEVFALSDVVSGWGTNTDYEVADINDIYKWQLDPVKYNKNIRNLSLYWYSQKGVLSEVCDLYKTLPTLDSSISCSNKDYSNYDSDMKSIYKFDSRITKNQIREMLLECAIMGTLITYRRGTIATPYIQILDLDYYYPARIKNGRWEVECDLMKFADGTAQQKSFRSKPQDMNIRDFESVTAKPELNSQPQEVIDAFNAWKDSRGLKQNNIYQLSMSKTGVVKNKSRQRERYGRPVGIAAFEDLLHKDLLKLAERAVVDKVIQTLLVVRLGEGGTDGYVPSTEQAGKVYNSIKAVLNEETKDSQNKLVGIPYWATIEALKVDLGIFENNKYEQIDQDILVSLGVSGILNAGQGNNYSSGKINENIFYSKVFDILEQIADEVFNVQFNQIVPNSDINFKKTFTRTVTVDNDTKLQVLQTLLDKGGSIKSVLDEVGVNFDDYIKQIKYEAEEVKTHDLLIPYQSTYTMSDGSDTGRPTGDNPVDNEESNNYPRPSEDRG